MEISPDKQNLDRVFSGTTYHIDFYQREYKWTSSPVERLLDDIFYKFNQKYSENQELDPRKEIIMSNYPWYYLNTYVTNTIEGRVYVVDGQQRLTTLTLILIKLFLKSKELECEDYFSQWIQNKVAGHSGDGYTFWMNHEKSTHVLEDLIGIPKDYKDINISDSVTSENMVKNFLIISKFLDGELSELHKLKTFIYYFLYRLVLINLSVETTEVPMVFKVINDRGVRLKPYEILKGKLLGQIDKQELTKYNDLWENRITKINNYKADEIDTFFRYYLKSKYSNTRDEGTKFDGEYHREMFTNEMNQKLELNYNTTNVKDFLETIFGYYSNLYGKILEAYYQKSDKYPSVFINKLNEMDGQFLLILSACKLEDTQEDQKIEKIAYEIDRLFSLLQLQNSYDSNAFSDILYKISSEIREGELGNIRIIFDKYLIAELSNQRNTEVKVPAQYTFFKNTGNNLSIRFKRYFFARIEDFLCVNLERNMQHPTQDLVLRTGHKTGFHIEHILSHNEENMGYFDNDEDKFEYERNRLGGLLLLRGRDNISSGNELYKDKLKTYAGTLNWNQTLIADYYKTHFNFNDMIQKYQLKFESINQFDSNALEARHQLLFEIVKIIWK